MLEIRENVPLAPLTTFQIGGPARFFAEALTEQDIAQAVAYAATHKLPLFILGGGSNLLVRDSGFNGLVLHIQIRGVNPLSNNIFAVGAGEPWDGFVQHTIQQHFAGIECLAGIPGSVGGTPVQNVGAYGQEVSETIVAVHAFDRQTQTPVILDKAACNFRYRASRFNTDEPNRYIVTRVDFKLHPNGTPNLRYTDLQNRFAKATKLPTLLEVANAIRDIRRGKGMLITPGDPDSRSAGSYFKNPILPTAQLPAIAAAALPTEKVPHWPAGEDLVKLPAAWLLEQSGFLKGYGSGPAGISTRHTLALVNRNHATFADIERLETEIVTEVRKKFNITLEREPVLLA